MKTIPVPEVKMFEVKKIKTLEKNPRKHPAEQIESLMESIKQYGFNAPPIVDKAGNLLAGHARLEAVKKMGIDEIPCLVVPLTGKAAREFVFVDNKIYEQGVWEIGKADLTLLQKMPDNLKSLFALDLSFLEGMAQNADIVSGVGKSMDDYKENYEDQKYVKLILLVPRRKYLKIEKKAGEAGKTAREFALDVVCKL